MKKIHGLLAVLFILICAQLSYCAEFPADGYLEDPTRTNGEVRAALEEWLAANKQIPGAGITPTTLTISGGEVTPSSGMHYITTEGAASTDTLDTISPASFEVGQILILKPLDNNYVVTVEHNAGSSEQIDLSGDADFVLNDVNSAIILQLKTYLLTTQWVEIGRVYGDSTAAVDARKKFYGIGGFEFFDSSTTWTAPAGCTTAKVYGCGGGGGGGEGSTSSVDGVDGTDGTASTIIDGTTTIATFDGGHGGQGGYSTGEGGGSDGFSDEENNNGQQVGTSEFAYGGSSVQTILGLYGSSGMGGQSSPGQGGGGGSGTVNTNQFKVITFTPGTEYTITIGTGGSGGSGGSVALDGEDGEDGAILIEW